MADLSDLSRTLRLLLESEPEAPPLAILLTIVDNFVLEISNSPSPGTLLKALENELQTIYRDYVADNSQFEVFVAVLYHLQPILPPASLIETWFDLVLRPALRDPKLPTPALNHAKELIIAALDSRTYTDIGARDESEEEREKELARQREKVGDFRRRLMELYLLAVYNESSGQDVLEWASLNGTERDKQGTWKANLEDVLIKSGIERPQDFLTEIYRCFSAPSSRLQLLILLNAYTSQPDFPKVAPALAAHPLTTGLLHSLLFDGSSTAAIVGLTVLTKLLPIFAVKACEDLKRLLPLLLAVLARIMCWREREVPSSASSEGHDAFSDGEDRAEENQEARESVLTPPIRKDLEWTRLEQTFDGGTSSPPSVHRYFTVLYYLFPCNVIRFLRYPAQYINDSGLDNPYDAVWADVLDEAKIRSKSEPLMRGHVLHPLLIWRTPAEELSQPDFWAQYDIARIVGDCTMLDVRNAALGMQQRAPAILSTDPEAEPEPEPEPEPTTVASPASPAASSESVSVSLDSSVMSSPTVRPVELSAAAKPRVSLQDMIATSIALRSGMDIEVVHPSPSWSAGVYPSLTQTQSHLVQSDGERHLEDATATTATADEEPARRDSLRSVHTVDERSIPMQVEQALAGLQREVLLLRNELNFELWNARENVKHIGRLYQDRVLSKTAEMERQGLHNKMREYKQEVGRLQRELKDHKTHNTKVKTQYLTYNRNLQDKVAEFRKEKLALVAETAALRAADKEAKDTFAAQEKLLADAVQNVLQLETRIKENAHKVDRLHDYERQIDQLIKLQRLWELDVQKLNDQADYLQVFTSKYRKMELRLQAYEQTQADVDQILQDYRRQIRTLETQLTISRGQLEGARKSSNVAKLSTVGVAYSEMKKANERLREENADLRDEVEEVKAMVEVLKARMPIERRSESRGVRSESREGDDTMM